MTKHTLIIVLAFVLAFVAACSGPANDPPPPSYGQTTQGLAQSGANYTFPAGSLIIPTDTTYQDTGIFLAYGLVYQLLRNNVHVSWVIKPGKRLATIAPAGATRSGTIATFTTTQPHALGVGEPVVIRNVGVVTYNGTWSVTAVLSPTQFTVTLAATPAANSGNGTVTPSDFVASATDKQGGPAVVNYGYRSGPFVIDAADAAVATPIVDAWQAGNPTMKVHVTTAPFTGFVKRQLVAAPTVAQFDDGNASIASAYLNAAKIPDSQGLAWTATSTDLLTPAEVAGATCAGTGDCKNSDHADGSLFDSNHVPAYCQMMSMHWGVGNAATDLGREVVREYRTFLRFPTHLFAECQAVNAIENNTNVPIPLGASPTGATAAGTTATFTIASVPLAASPTGATEAGTTATFTTTVNHNLAVGDIASVAGVGTAGYNGAWTVATIVSATRFTAVLPASGLAASGGGTVTKPHQLAVGDSVLIAGVPVAGYNGTWVVTAAPSPTQFAVAVTTSGLGASGGGTMASFNGLFLTRSGYAIGAQPAEVDSYSYDQPFAQYDGRFNTTGGSEPSYTIPPNGGYKAQDVVMLTERPTAIGVDDVWMTGFLDGQCLTTQEYCDPQFAQGKVSYLGGHNYGTSLPISSGNSQGARLFLNALLEAPCATDLGVASLGISKTGPTSSNTNQVSYSLTAFNNSTSVAGTVVVADTLVAGAAFVPPTPPAVVLVATRATNVVTITTSAAHNFSVGTRVTVTGATNPGFNGTFTITAVPASTQLRYTQVGANLSSNGGTVRNAFDGVCVGTAAQCGGSGGGVVTFDVGAIAGGQSVTVNVIVQFQAPANYSNTARVTYKAGSTTLTALSNTTSTCYYAGNPSICSSGCDPAAPACANGCDDDNDGLIDFPDDTGCHAATDTAEADFATTGPIKARVLIVFDTSGSMMWNTCRDDFTGGDGSLSCPGADVACAPSPPGCGASGCGNGLADDSRILKVKTGISNVVNGFGEVEWGLMKFRQLPTEFSCGTLNVNKNDGGWQGAGSSPCTGFAAGDVVVKFDPDSTNSLLAYMDGSTNYTGPPPPGKDFELRASGNTPLAGSLASARTYVAQTRSTDSPVVAGCRPYRVILVTDGAETCAGNPVAAAGALFATGDADGRVPVHVIGFSTPNASVQTQLNQIASAGGTTAFVPADDSAQLSAAIESIVQGTILKELCNDLDDDCDGAIDEDFPDKGAMCGNGGKGACARAGVRVCSANGSGTECNAVSVSCVNNRLVDGSGNDLGPCVETCNNADDDCDGRIDEGVSCNCQVNTETCNGADDDCDGIIDEDVTSGCTDCCVAACCKFDANGGCIENCTQYQDVGECDFGDTVCAGGGTVCVNYVGPQPEICDGLDNDCDGTVDDMAICPNSGDLCVAGQCVFACQPSEFPCSFGYVCKSIPNCGLANCDFCSPDPCLNKTCPSGFQCDSQTGNCVDLCASVNCAVGQTCRNGFCLDCFAFGCAPGERCVAGANGVGGCRADACAGVTCAADEFCDAGVCTPTTCSPACPANQACVNGSCQPDKCVDGRCAAGQICNPTTGGCLVDPCQDVQCPQGQACQPSTSGCIPDPCAVVVCPEGLSCKLTFDGVATCKAPPAGELVTTGGGGGCAAGGEPSAPTGLALLLALGVMRRRKGRMLAGDSPSAS